MNNNKEKRTTDERLKAILANRKFKLLAVR